MTIEDIKSKKMELEEMMLKLISDFEDSTGILIDDIQINRNFYQTCDGTWNSTDIEVKVKI